MKNQTLLIQICQEVKLIKDKTSLVPLLFMKSIVWYSGFVHILGS